MQPYFFPKFSLSIKRSLFFCLFLIAGFVGCYKEQTIPVTVNYSIQIVDSNYMVPVRVVVTNATLGAAAYNWTFEGGSPASSTKRDPGTISYATPGTYKIKLSATNENGGSDSKEMSITVDTALKIAFNVVNTHTWYPDVTLQMLNNSIGATQYQWTFSGGTPSSSTEKNPQNIVFSTPGKHQISLKISNSRTSLTKDTTIEVLPALTNSFEITWLPVNNDKQAPFTAILNNQSISATQYQWTFSGGTPSSSTEKNPKVVYTAPGTYTLTLKTSNDKASITQSKTITVLPNTNLLSFSDVKLGINTAAQDSIGAAFSAYYNKAFKTKEINATNGNYIDFVYYGLNQSFGYNIFLSPDMVQGFSFPPIPNAAQSLVINQLATCNCGLTLSASQFDNMQDGALLSSLSFPNTTTNPDDYFGKPTLPYILLFKTADGRKGAIKIKTLVNQGIMSYLVADIKITKNP